MPMSLVKGTIKAGNLGSPASLILGLCLLIEMILLLELLDTPAAVDELLLTSKERMAC